MTWDNPVEQQIAILRNLDAIDRAIQEIGAQQDAVRKQADALKAEISSFHAGLADIDREMTACRTQQKEAEYELDRVEKKLKKLNRGLASGSEKEFEASRKEQAHLTTRKDELEDVILGCMETADDLVERKKALQAHIHTRKKAITVEYDALKEQFEALKQRLEQQRRDRELLIPQLDVEYRYTYRRLMQRYDRSTVSVVGDRCTGCQLFVPPQHVVDVLMGRALHTCQHCGRFILPEETGGEGDESQEVSNE